MLLTSRNNPAVKKLAALQEKKYRVLYGEYLAEGEKPVTEAIACNKEITALYLSQTVAEKGNISLDVPTYILSDELFEKVSTEKSPQGAIALLRLPALAPQKPKGSCLLLDGVADPGNMGTIIRTANAAGYDEIYLLHCTDPYAPKAVRASMSGIFHTTLYTITEESLDVLSGVPLITADLNGENIFTFTLPDPEKFCLCIGNEGHGLSEAVKRRSSYTVTIPMRKTQESLNAGVSAGIAMYLLKKSTFIG
jgi:TrmH family RNA methyltransferase